MAILPSRGADDTYPPFVKIIGERQKVLAAGITEIKWLREETGAKFGGVEKGITGLNGETAVEKAKPIYLQTLSDASAAVTHTKKKFDYGLDKAALLASDAFFGDILNHYSRTSKAVELMTASNIPEVEKAILSDLDRTQSAYLMVADHNSLTFDMKVETDPEGAVITYRREAEDFKTYEDRSNTTIKNLVVATWLVHVELKDYKPDERWHDAANNPDSKVVFVLKH